MSRIQSHWKARFERPPKQDDLALLSSCEGTATEILHNGKRTRTPDWRGEEGSRRRACATGRLRNGRSSGDRRSRLWCCDEARAGRDYCYKKDHVGKIDSPDLLNAKKKKKYSVRDAIADLPEPRNSEWVKYKKKADEDLSSYAKRARSVPAADLGSGESRLRLQRNEVSGVLRTVHTPEVVERFREVEPGTTDAVSRCPRLEWSEAAPTLRAGTGPDKGSYQSIRPIHPTSDRVITVREAARLQGFPDWFQFDTTKWHSFRMIGNSFSPPLSGTLLRLMSERLEA